MSSFDSYSTIKRLFVLGTTTSAFCSGGLLFTSYMHVPAYTQNASDASLLHQWQTMVSVAKVATPPLALVAAGANLLNAYLTRTQPLQYRFVAAGVLSLAVFPYSMLALGATNFELQARDEKTEGSTDYGLRELSVRELIGRWGARNAVRGFLLLASTMCSCDAMLHLTF